MLEVKSLSNQPTISTYLLLYLLWYLYLCVRTLDWQFRDDILGYIRYLLNGINPNAFRVTIGNYIRRVREVEIRQQCEDDLTVLRNLVAMENPTLLVRFVHSIDLLEMFWNVLKLCHLEMSWNVLKLCHLEMSWNVLKCLEIMSSWNVLKCLEMSSNYVILKICLEMSWNVLKCLETMPF